MDSCDAQIKKKTAKYKRSRPSSKRVYEKILVALYIVQHMAAQVTVISSAMANVAFLLVRIMSRLTMAGYSPGDSGGQDHA